MTIQIETNCSPTRCTITIKVNGNGGSDSTQEVEDPTSTTAFVLCVGSPPCCVTVFPCPDWAAAAASCAGSKVECQ
jgi:hypothetical protein